MKSYLNLLFLSLFFVLFSCTQKEEKIVKPFPVSENPWEEIRKERISKLLPEAMKEAGVEAWIVICRENNNDPLAMHVGGENAGGSAAFMFFNIDGKFKSLSLSPVGEATALGEKEILDEVIAFKRGTNVWKHIAEKVKEWDPKVIAINSSNNNIADGLSYTQRKDLEKALGKKYTQRLVPSVDLVYEWLSVKLPKEIEIMSKAAKITADLQIEAYNTIIPGKTTDADVAKFLKKRMAELGVTDAWAPDQNPNVNSGPNRGHSHSTDKIIQPGDVIQTDFGIRVFDQWVTDIQRFAYVLKDGETKAPDDIQSYFNNSITGIRKIQAAMKPGITGWDVDKVQRDWMKECGSLPIMWGTGHPVGYWAHDAGPALSGAARYDEPVGNSARKLKPGQTFAYDGFYHWEREDGTRKAFSVEEMVYITEDGAKYMTEPQEELILIPSK